MITAEEVLTGIKEAPAPDIEEKDEKDPAKVKQRVPPSRGLCRRCGENKPINRLMLCYPCWVKDELEKSGWKDGQPHPDWCACEGIKDHQRRSDGN
jgi:hypothetical protein